MNKFGRSLWGTLMSKGLSQQDIVGLVTRKLSLDNEYDPNQSLIFSELNRSSTVKSCTNTVLGVGLETLFHCKKTRSMIAQEICNINDMGK